MNHQLEIFDNGQVRWLGVDTGKTKVLAHNVKEKMICLHIAGHYYSSFPIQKYAPAQVTVYRYELVEPFEKTKRFEAGMRIKIDELFGFLSWQVRG